MLVVLNHKMNFTLEEVRDYKKIIDQYKLKDIELVICPSLVYLPLFDTKNYNLGSQNVSCYENGSYTGEVSASQLKSLGVTYCLVGHSERRKYQNEDGLLLIEKIKRLLEVNITPILCIGETKEEKQDNKTNDVLKKEIDLLSSFSKEELSKIIIAYEPIWAIGTGLVPSKEEVMYSVKFIKDTLTNKYQVTPQVLYGGSINADNYNTFKNISNIDGLLVGGLSLKVEKLKQLFENE